MKKSIIIIVGILLYITAICQPSPDNYLKIKGKLYHSVESKILVEEFKSNRGYTKILNKRYTGRYSIKLETNKHYKISIINLEDRTTKVLFISPADIKGPYANFIDIDFSIANVEAYLNYDEMLEEYVLMVF